MPGVIKHYRVNWSSNLRSARIQALGWGSHDRDYDGASLRAYRGQAKFVVMSNVLGGIRDYDRGGWLVGQDAYAKAAVAVMRSGKTLAPPRVLGKEIGRLLRIAWQTELAARVSDVYDDDMLRRVAAQTLPVQAYYAVFNAARAMTASAGTTCGTHQAIHRDFESQRARRSYRSWGVTLAGDPLSPTDCILMPAITTPKSFNPMELTRQPEDYVWSARPRRSNGGSKQSRWLSILQVDSYLLLTWGLERP